MSNLRDIRKRIRSVRSTQKITRAMKMVAAARLRRAQKQVTQATPYADKMEELLRKLAGGGQVHPLLTPRPVKKRLLVVFSSDRGLCGAFNSNLLRRAQEELKKNEAPTMVVAVGRKAITFYKRRSQSSVPLPGFWDPFTWERTVELGREWTSQFLAGEVDQVDLLYSRFESVITHRPTLTTLLPIRPPEEAKKEDEQEPLYEPGKEEILAELLPRATEVRLYVAALNARASELGARLTAMDAATRNSKDLIDKLTLDMNRARQATITRELMEIIAGAEAMK